MFVWKLVHNQQLECIQAIHSIDKAMSLTIVKITLNLYFVTTEYKQCQIFPKIPKSSYLEQRNSEKSQSM